MKSATLPPLRVTQELRQAAEAVLAEGETLSSFMEQSLRESIDRRRAQQAFIERGLTARAESIRTGEYYDADEVLKALDDQLGQAESSR